jgi:hypothetical protein
MSPAGSAVWALLPLLTFGLGTAFVLGWAAYRLRSRRLAVGGVVALVVTFAALALSDSSRSSGQNAMGGGLILVVLIAGGLAVTFSIRNRLTRPAGGPATDPDGWLGAAPRPPATDPVVAEALARRARRLEARRILERDPGLARELLIGRPDLPRRFDDGGLVDVNHVPVAVIAALPGLTPELAEQIVQARDQHSGFAFFEELAAYADLPDGLAEELSERLVFVH